MPTLPIATALSRRSVLTLAAGMMTFLHLARESRAQATPTPVDVLSAASARLAAVQSMHFELEIEGTTYIDDSQAIQLKSANGDLARPDKVACEFQVSLFDVGTVSIRMITIGERSWTTDLITGNWDDAPPEFGYDPSILYDNQNGLGPVTGKLDDTSVLGKEAIDDRQTWHVTGTSPAAEIRAVTAGTMLGDAITVELWIDEETSDMVRVRLTEPVTESKDDPAVWTLTMSRFDEKVTIEAPDD